MADTIQPIYHAFDLGFDTEDIKRVAIQQDSDKTHILVISVYTNDDQMVLSPTWEYHITMRKPDGKLVVNSSNIEIRDNKIYVTCTAQMLSAPGTSICELVIFNDSQSLYTNKFYIYVDEDLISGDDIESTNEFNSIVDVLRLIQQYAQNASASAQNAADAESMAESSAENAEEYEIRIREILDSLDDYDAQITQLINQLTAESEEIEGLRQRVMSSVDDVQNLVNELNEIGGDQLRNIVDNAMQIYDNIQSLETNCTAMSDTITNTATLTQSAYNDINSMLTTVSDQYGTFTTQYNDFTSRMNNIQTFLDNMESIQSEIEQNRANIASSAAQASSDASAISSMREEIESLLEQMREQAEHSATAFDPIVIKPTQPDPSVQTTDDMWLEPYN